MADMLSANRIEVLSGKAGGGAGVQLHPAPAASRASLRAGSDALDALGGALGLSLPTQAKTSSSNNGHHALWIGPDEWLLIGPEGTDYVGMTAQTGALHSMVDISHRNVGMIVSGPKAARAINAACPLDLSDAVFPVGACARTVFGKIEIVLYRMSEDSYRVECWRSFAGYCFGLLHEGAADAAH